WIQADVGVFGLKKPYVLVAAGCSPTRTAKRWPTDRYANLCVWLAGLGFTPVLLGTQDEGDVNAQIADACPEAVDLTGKTSLFQIAVLARDAALAVGNDTGPV